MMMYVKRSMLLIDERRVTLMDVDSFCYSSVYIWLLTARFSACDLMPFESTQYSTGLVAL